MDHSVVLCWFHPFCALHRIIVSSIKGRVGARYKYNFRKQDFSMLLFIVGYFWTLLYSLICRSKRPVGWIFGYLSGRVSQRPNRKLNIAYSQNQPRKWLQISVKQKITSCIKNAIVEVCNEAHRSWSFQTELKLHRKSKKYARWQHHTVGAGKVCCKLTEHQLFIWCREYIIDVRLCRGTSGADWWYCAWRKTTVLISRSH